MAFYLGDSVEGERAFREAQLLLKGVQDLSDRLLIYPTYAALTWLTQRRRECDDAVEQLDNLVRESQAAGFYDSRVIRLHTLHGCLLAARGKYAEALDRHSLAFTLARKLGNDYRERVAAENLSICHGRLGQYQEQRRWTERALQLSSPPIDDWDRIRNASRLAWSLCMQGENSRGVSTFEELAPVEDTSGRLWVRQARELLRADIYLIAKSEHKAMEVARSALDAQQATSP